MNIKMPRPKITILDLIQIVITQRLIYVRCINIIKKHVLRNNYSSSNSTPRVFFSRVFI